MDERRGSARHRRGMSTARRILFADPWCYKPYDTRTLETGVLGGSEATTARVARALALHGCQVHVLQEARKGADSVAGVRYTHHAEEAQFDFVISLRYPKLAREMLARFPDARHFVWLHDLDPEGIVEFMAAMPFDGVRG